MKKEKRVIRADDAAQNKRAFQWSLID